MSSYGAKGTRTPNNRLQRTAAEPERSLAWRTAAMAELNDAVHELIEALCAEGDTCAKKAKYCPSTESHSADDRQDEEIDRGFLWVIRPSTSTPVGFLVYLWANSVTILPTPSCR
jgi:hypothetical protein